MVGELVLATSPTHKIQKRMAVKNTATESDTSGSGSGSSSKSEEVLLQLRSD